MPKNLKALSKKSIACRQAKKKLPKLLENKKDFPEKPGIYLFKTAAGKVLYIGKAVNLKKRISQYFQKKDNPLLQNLLQRAAKLEYIVTAAEHDALLLESNLVHTYQPSFNIRLKDDKSFPFIQITLNEDFPGIYYSRHVDPGCFGLGPLVSSQKTRDLIDTVARLFLLRSCTNSTFKKKVPCLYFHIDRCSAPCAGKIDLQFYRQQVQDAVNFLKGRKRKVAAKLAGEMRHFSAALDFEQAQKIKQDLELMDKFSLHSYISTRARIDWDILTSSSLGNESFFAFFAVVRGQVRKSEYFNLPTIDNGEDEVLRGPGRSPGKIVFRSGWSPGSHQDCPPGSKEKNSGFGFAKPGPVHSEKRLSVFRRKNQATIVFA
jgi:excinuclease ABC subunit C